MKSWVLKRKTGGVPISYNYLWSGLFVGKRACSQTRGTIRTMRPNVCLSRELISRVLLLGKVRFYWGAGGWAGALEGRVIGKYFTNWGGSNLFDTQPGEGHSLFWQGKYYSMSVS